MLGEVKAHVGRHKKAYLIGSYVVYGGILILVTRRVCLKSIPSISIAPVFNNVINNTVNNAGHMRKIVRCIETGQLWLSVTDTAEALGKSISVISQHLNHPDLSPDINGLHYVIEALAVN